MDGFSRYVKIFLLKSKAEGEVNNKNLVRQVLTDKGQEFCNGAMAKWYKKKGIVHTKVGPNVSQLNPVERTHQTLVDMVNTMMHQSGLPASFWTSALEAAVYVKNRVFCKGAGCTPYEMTFDSKPDIRHIRAFGSLAYCHTPKSKRKKFAMNCKMEFLIGYREDLVGCQVYFPTEHKKGFVSDVKINEAIKYKDRHESGYKGKVNKWLQTFNEFINEGEFDDFAAADHDGDDSSHQADYDAESERCASIDMEEIESVAGSEDENAHGVWNGRLHSKLPTIQLQHQADVSSEISADRELWDEILRASSLPDYDDAFEETQEGEGTRSRRDSDTEVDPEEAENNSTTEVSPENVDVDNESAEAVSETAAADAEDQSDYSDQDENEDEHEVEVDEDYAQSIAHITDLNHVVETELRGGADYDCLFDPADARELSEVADDVNDGNDRAWISVTDHELVASELPKDQKLLKTMWVYDLKEDHLGYVTEFRARIVGRGDTQRPGLEYLETFSPVARMATFRLFVAVSTFLGLIIYQGDINTAYLNALLTIKQYLEDLDGYPCEVDGMMYMINKALYGLKQSGREWNTEVNDWSIRYGFKRCSTEPCLYFYERDGEFAIVLLYVDDILCATKNEEFKKKMFNQLNEDYGLKDQGLLNTYLGIEVEQNDRSIKIHQTMYCEQILERFGFSDAHPSRIPMETKLRLTMNDTDTASRKQVPRNGKVFPYRELVGSLMYLATCTRPDLAYAVGQLSRYVQSPTQQHISAAKRLLSGTLVLDGFCDSDWGNDPDTRKSVTGYVHCMTGGAISWASRRQPIVAPSTAEAEYVAACEACMEGQGLRNVLTEVFPMVKTEFRLGIDNQAVFVMATNPTYSRRTRHIELRWHYVRDRVAKKMMELWKVKTDVNPSDLMTKPLASERFDMLNDMIGMTKQHLPK
ncbi:unnamed protein product [Phytophthora fragariaefolia]|uniref:Unnamed protein product n=1 Tax=Phytophthora fragariaefolia TaxID=1490495 RepID=A0A9W6XRL2_9STRA|nr:unnamed protein product [Phytophthora fragariaefolia]